MKLVYTHENKLLVENAKNLLTQHAIECTLRNEFAAGGIGDLAPIQAWPELWLLDDADIPEANQLIATLAVDSDASEWECSACGEINEPAFESCWSCQADRSQ
jgi:hypothetical protein